MSSWARKMHRGAATISSVVTCGHSNVPYTTRMEKVKFGVPLDQVCRDDIPGPLLVLILKLNKEAPHKKDIFRAPGHQGNMKKLIHFLQHGRLINIDNFSVYTIASVLKKFLRKLPGGIFGAENEEELFDIINIENIDEKRDRIHRLIISLPVVAQHLLVLLFGTFRAIALAADRAQTGMSSEALGVSVAPSFFQSCVSDGKIARMEDVVRFKVATRIMKFLVDNFGVSNLFGRENYEYYARITGSILKVEEDWIFAFRYPPDSMVSRKASLQAEKSWLEQEAERWGLRFNLEDTVHDRICFDFYEVSVGLSIIQEGSLGLLHLSKYGRSGYEQCFISSRAISSQEECQSTPALIHSSDPMVQAVGTAPSGSLTNLGEAYTRLSVSLEENGIYQISSPSLSTLHLDELKEVNRYAESTKSLSFLPQVHERQAARMRTRSEWFLNPSPCPSPIPMVDIESNVGACKMLNTEGIKCASTSSSASSNSATQCSSNEKQLIRRTSSKEKRLVRRSSSKKQDKENGNNYSSKYGGTSSPSVVPFDSKVQTTASPKKVSSGTGSPGITEQDCTEVDVQTFHVTLTYKPRI